MQQLGTAFDDDGFVEHRKTLQSTGNITSRTATNLKLPCLNLFSLVTSAIQSQSHFVNIIIKLIARQCGQRKIPLALTGQPL